MPSVATSGIAEINNYWLACHDNKRIFALVPKNGNTTVKRAILRNSSETTYVTKDEVIRKYGNYEVVTVVRNPFYRLVSCYEFFQKVQPHHNRSYEFPTLDSFQDFIEEIYNTPDEISNKHFRSQYNLLSQDGIFLPSVVVDFKNLSGVSDYFPIDYLEEQKMRKERRPYQEYYSDYLKKLVETRFWRDFDYFNYSF